MRRIEIVPAQASWKTDFIEVRGRALKAAPSGAYLHHIGSTAVDGLPAKDIIDMQLTVDDLSAVDDSALTAQGFIRTKIISDHCPPGISLEVCQLEKLLYNYSTRPANLHIRVAGRYNQRFAVLCRDFLRSHRAAALAYAEIKESLAKHFPENVDSYYSIKDPVFDLIIAGAEEWAARTGWQQPMPD